MTTSADQSPTSRSRIRAMTLMVVVATILAVIAPGWADAGPGDGVVRRFNSPGVAIPGETITLKSIQPCKPGHRGSGQASMATAFDRNGNAREVTRTTFKVDQSGTWTARITIPAAAKPGAYMFGAICGGGPSGAVETGYQLNYVQLSGECLKPYFVGLRGSGEGVEGNGIGGTLDAVFERLANGLGRGNIDIVPRANQERYNAVKVGDWRYFTSVNSGKNLAVDEVRNRVEACGDAAKIVMAGYSQGAQATVEALNALTSRERSKVAGVVLFGSPVHMPYMNGDAGPAHNFGLTVLLTSRRLLPLPDGLPNRMRDYCSVNDPVCDPAQGAPTVMLGESIACGRNERCVHRRYGETHADSAARYILDRLR